MNAKEDIERVNGEHEDLTVDTARVQIVDFEESETGIALGVEPTPEEVEEGLVKIEITLPLLKKVLNTIAGVRGEKEVEEKLGLLFEEAKEMSEASVEAMLFADRMKEIGLKSIVRGGNEVNFEWEKERCVEAMLFADRMKEIGLKSIVRGGNEVNFEWEKEG